MEQRRLRAQLFLFTVAHYIVVLEPTPHLSMQWLATLQRLQRLRLACLKDMLAAPSPLPGQLVESGCNPSPT